MTHEELETKLRKIIDVAFDYGAGVVTAHEGMSMIYEITGLPYPPGTIRIQSHCGPPPSKKVCQVCTAFGWDECIEDKKEIK